MISSMLARALLLSTASLVLACSSGTTTSASVSPGAPSSRESPAAGSPSTMVGAAPTALGASAMVCPATLQSLVDGATPGATLRVPRCLYRETITIAKPLSLVGSPGAEIRGSDIWRSWTKLTGGVWQSAGRVPPLDANGDCRAGSSRCRWPEQVFVDGVALRQVAEGPAANEFAIGSGRRVILGSDPTGRVIEVTTRSVWITVEADDVTISGFRMRHAAVDAQHGAIENTPDEPADRMTITNNSLSDVHGATISVQGGSDHRIIANQLERAGQLGIHIGGVGSRGVTVERNLIRDTNTEDFDQGWESGGLKASNARGLTVTGNTVVSAGGPGLWFDGDCRNVVVRANVVRHVTGPGIFFETSRSGTIRDNVVWDAGWGTPDWAGGGGVVVDASRDVAVTGNVLAWNADGIGVESQDRSDGYPVRNVTVRDNVIIGLDDLADSQQYGLAWVEDWQSGMFDPLSANGGWANRYWYPSPERGAIRFEWGRPLRRLRDFERTPGETGGRYLTDTEMKVIAAEAGIPSTPPAH